MVGALGGVEHWEGGGWDVRSIGRLGALGGWKHWEGGSIGRASGSNGRGRVLFSRSFSHSTSLKRTPVSVLSGC